MEQLSSGFSTGLGGYAKSVRRLAIASLIIGLAIWYTDRTSTVNIVEVPAQINPVPAVDLDSKAIESS